MLFLKLIIFLAALGGLISWNIRGMEFDRQRIQSDGAVYAGRLSAFKTINYSRAFFSVILLAALLTLFSALWVIAAGHRGVIFSQGTGVRARILNEGFNVVIPVVHSVIPVSVRVRKHTVVLDVNQGAAASKDIQDVGVNVTVNYHYDAKKVNVIYRDIGPNDVVTATILVPKTQDAIKRSTAKFDAEDMIANRGKLGDLIKTTLADRLASSHLIVDDISVENISFKPDFSKEIEDKVKQKQIAKKEELKVAATAAIARQKIAEAEGIKQSRILQAEGIARANELLEVSLTEGVLRQRWIDTWNGVLPIYVGGDNAGTLLNLPAPPQE